MEETSTTTFDDFAVGSLPTVYYIPEYLNADEEQHLLNNIYKSPISKWKSLKNRRLQNWGGVVHEKGLLAQDLPPWLKKITQRIYEELSLFPSDINHVLINEYLPDQGIMPHQDGPAYFPVVAILSLGSPVVMDFAPHPSFRNSGQISENEDEEATELSRVETTVSGKKSNEPRPFSVVLMPRSLLIFKDEAYSDYLHGIRDSDIHQLNEAVNVTPEMSVPGLKVDGDGSNRDNGAGMVIHRTSTRVSLTCRVVSKVRKHLIKI